MCTMGLAPGNLTVTNNSKEMIENKPIATIQDAVGMSNITPCGNCVSMMYPPTASATAAALGVLTPQPCMPQTTGIWTGSQSKKLVNNVPALSQEAKCQCVYGGTISIVNPSQFKGSAG